MWDGRFRIADPFGKGERRLRSESSKAPTANAAGSPPGGKPAAYLVAAGGPEAALTVQLQVVFVAKW